MVARVLIVLAFAFGFTSSAWAYYVNLEPPTNWIPKELSPWPGYAALIVRAQTGTNTAYFGGEEEWERARRCSALWTGGSGRPMGSGVGGSVGGGSSGGSGVSNMGMWWRPGCDGPAFHLNSPGVFRGVRTSAVDPSAPYGDPWLDWLWRMSPGAQAQAFVPAAVYAGSLVSAALRVGGRTIFVPAFLKYAPNAGRAISKQVWRGAAVTVVAGLLGGLADYIWDDLEKRWKKPSEVGDVSDGYLYSVGDTGWHGSKIAACRAYVPTFLASQSPRVVTSVYVVENDQFACRIAYTLTEPCCGGVPAGYKDVYSTRILAKQDGACPVGSWWTPAGCMPQRPTIDVPEDEFIEKTEYIEWPEEVPEHLPDGLPVESPPKINPLPSPWDPPSPYFDPVGDPVKNPKYNPDLQPGPENPPWVQPGRRIKPAPTTDNPWQVDVEPVEKPVEIGPDGKPLPEPEPTADPTKNPIVDPADPTDPNNPASRPELRPSEKQPLLCEVFPWISACQPLGNAPSPTPLPDRVAPVSVSPAGGFGPSEGACPSPVSISVMGSPFEISWEPICEVVSSVRPVVIALAWFTVALTMFGFARKGD